MTSLFSFDGSELHRTHLLSMVKEWAKDEDAHFYSSSAEVKENEWLDLDEGIWVTSKNRYMYGVNKVSWRGLGVRRGVLIMGGSFPEWPTANNWYIGFTTAGNGTPAGIFPVNDDYGHAVASFIVSEFFI